MPFLSVQTLHFHLRIASFMYQEEHFIREQYQRWICNVTYALHKERTNCIPRKDDIVDYRASFSGGGSYNECVYDIGIVHFAVILNTYAK